MCGDALDPTTTTPTPVAHSVRRPTHSDTPHPTAHARHHVPSVDRPLTPTHPPPRRADAEKSIIKKYEGQGKFLVMEPAAEYVIDRTNNGLYR